MLLSELAPTKNDERVGKFKELMHGSSPRLTPGDQKDRLKEFGEFMATKGFTPLGNGLYGIVFEHPGFNYVIKVFKDDSRYRQFVAYCEGSDARHLPRFKGRILTIDKRHFLVRMEKLRPLETPEERSVGALIGRMNNRSGFSKGDYNFYKAEFSKEYGLAFKYLEETQPKFMQTIYNIVGYDSGLDLHPANMMVRPSDDSIVITDPWA